MKDAAVTAEPESPPGCGSGGPARAPSHALRFLQEYSIPLIAGVVAALGLANLAPDAYLAFVHAQPFGDVSILGHSVTVHFLIDDVFMVLFFGVAAKEITEAALPGGSLHPLRNAINPLIATLGGVVGPVAAFFVILAACAGAGFYPEGLTTAELQRGWGIPTATDIALAWLVARTVFGKGHPAIDFLLLLAVADDAIGLGIIAVFYGDPHAPAEPIYLVLVLLGMGVAFAMRKLEVARWQPYILVAGPIAWSGLMLAHLHPALALVFIVPFLPGPARDTDLFVEQDEADAVHVAGHHSPLHLFEHDLKTVVDFGLFFFALANAGVELSVIGAMTWTILGALVAGKTLGIGLFAWAATKLGFALPRGMHLRDVAMAGFVAALGLTVALFVAGAAWDPKTPVLAHLQGQAKMGALFSGFVGIAAVAIGRALGYGRTRSG